MIGIPFRAVAAQTPWRFMFKALTAVVLVGIAAGIHKEGLVLSLLVIFSGITGPALRVMTLKMSGIFDRIRVSPVSRPSAVLVFTGIWSITVFAALVPAMAIALYLQGPALLVPLVTGTVLAVTIGTLAGLEAGSLGDAHLYAILASAPLIIGTLIPGPQFLLLPYPSMSMNAISLVPTVTQIGFLILMVLILTGIVSRM